MMKTLKRSSGAHLLSALLVALGLFANTANAASYVVSNANDSGAGSLRDAVSSANGDGTDSTITFNPTVFAAPRKTITAPPSINISQNVTITGPAAGVVLLSQNNFNIFTVSEGVSASFDGLTLSNGRTGVENNGTVTLTNCTLNGNVDGLLNYGSAATLINCTVSGSSNSGIVNGVDNSSGSGSGIGALVSPSVATLTNCTISGNGIGITNIDTVNVKNSIVAGNSTDTDGNAITSGGNNIIGGTATAAGLDPAGLQDNGGPSPTIALVSGSPAINTANDASAPAKDQRGIARPQGPHSDIGAYEAQIGLAIKDVSASEGNSGTTNFVFTVRLLLPAANTVTVGYATANGTATASSDYTAKSGTLTFPAGTTSATFTVLVNGDTTVEPSEIFYVNLSNPVNAPIVDGQAAGTIIADDFETQSLVVNTTSGVLDNTDGVTSLPDAVAYANSDADQSAITFSPTVFAAPRKTITIGSGLTTSSPGLTLTQNVTITGPAAGVTVESGNQASSMFHVKSGVTAGFDGLTASKAFYGILNSGTATITNCTLNSNNDTGFYNFNGTATLANCTLSGNSFFGLSNSSGTASLANCTVSGNTGGLKNDFSGNKLNLKNTIVAGNTTNTDGPMTYGVNNIAAGTAAAAGLETDGTGLPILKDNDGPTKTIALIPGGAAVDGASDADAPATDQRGYARPQGTHSDIGAFELAPLVLVISDVTANEGNSGTTNFVFTVKLLRTSANAVTVGYATANGTATAGTDYTAKSGTLTIPAGAYSATISVAVNGDLAYEPNETFFVNLSSPVNATISDAQGVGTINTDEFETPSLVVNTTGDALDNTDGVNSLREAIAYANSNPDASTITFNIPAAQKTGGIWIIGTGSKLVISEKVTITGPGASLLTVKESDASKSFAVFEVTNDTTLTGLTLSNGSYGLANPSAAKLTLTGCVVSNNGSGLYSQGTATLTSSTVSSNSGAGIVNSGTATLTGCTLSSNSGPGVVNQGTVTLTNCTVSGSGSPGLVNDSGKTATLTNCTLSTNYYGIVNSGTLTLADSTVSGSTSYGIYNGGTATVTGSTISGNGENGFINGSGTATTLTNCTLSGNVTGLLNQTAITMTNCTVTGNTTTGILNSGGTTTAKNSLIVGNGTNLNGSLGAASSNNLTTGTAADAGLDPNGLKDNGGPTKTIALLSTSPAINTANDADAPAKDQRGVVRPQGVHSDLGAYEFQPDTTAPTVRFLTSATTPTGTTPVNGGTLTDGIPTITGAATDAGGGVAKVDLRLYRATATAGVYEYWNGTAWSASATNLATTLNPVAGGANVSWSKSGGWPTGANFADGTYFLQALGYDKANNSANVVSNFKKVSDKTAPVVSIVTPEHLSAVIAFTSAKGIVTDTGGSGIDRVDLTLRRVSDLFYWNGTAWTKAITQLPTVVTGTNWSKTTGLPAPGTDTATQLLEGKYTLVARAYDKTGNTSAPASSNFTVDRTVPASVTLATPAHLSVVKSLVSVNGTSADNPGGSGIGRVDLSLRRNSDLLYWNGTAWGKAITQLPTVITSTGWSKSGGLPVPGTDAGTQLLEGKYIVVARAYDKAGNLFPAVANTFTFDNTMPVSVGITAPANLSSVKAISSVTGTATDNTGGSGIGRVDLSLRRVSDLMYWNGTTWVTALTQLPTAVISAGWVKNTGLPAAGTNPTTQLIEGKYILVARAYDRASNPSGTVISNVTVDRTLPTAAITAPVNNSVVSSLASVSGTAFDALSGPASIDLTLKRLSDNLYWTGSVWTAMATTLTTTAKPTTDGNATWTYGNTTQLMPKGANLVDGSYLLSARAVDKAANLGTTVNSRFTLTRTAALSAPQEPAQTAVASNLLLSSARATADGRVVLTFTGALDSNTVLDVARYSVTRGEVVVPVESAQSTARGTVVLGCEENLLNVGDRLQVSFDLKDSTGRSLAGQVVVIVR